LKVSGCDTQAQGRDHTSSRVRAVPDLTLPDDVTVHVGMVHAAISRRSARWPAAALANILPTYRWFVASC
jgi:hypothetical protein